MSKCGLLDGEEIIQINVPMGLGPSIRLAPVNSQHGLARDGNTPLALLRFGGAARRCGRVRGGGGVGGATRQTPNL